MPVSRDDQNSMETDEGAMLVARSKLFGDSPLVLFGLFGLAAYFFLPVQGQFFFDIQPLCLPHIIPFEPLL